MGQDASPEERRMSSTEDMTVDTEGREQFVENGRNHQDINFDDISFIDQSAESIEEVKAGR